MQKTEAFPAIVTILPKLNISVFTTPDRRPQMMFEPFSADTLILSFIVTVALREAMVAYLPASVVGPNGWLLRTNDRDDV